jgi:hypothetical protein
MRKHLVLLVLIQTAVSRHTFTASMFSFSDYYAQGLARVGVQSAIPHPETEALLRQMMKDRGLPIPADITSSICLTKGVNGCH